MSVWWCEEKNLWLREMEKLLQGLQQNSLYCLQSFSQFWLRKTEAIESYKLVEILQSFSRSERHQRQVKGGGKGDRELLQDQCSIKRRVPTLQSIWLSISRLSSPQTTLLYEDWEPLVFAGVKGDRELFEEQCSIEERISSLQSVWLSAPRLPSLQDTELPETWDLVVADKKLTELGIWKRSEMLQFVQDQIRRQLFNC